MPVQTSNMKAPQALVAGEPYELASGRKGGGSGRTSREGSQRRSPKIDGPKRVLVFGRLLELALYRAEVLRSRGFSVITPKSKLEAVAVIERGEFDAVVLSYTLPSETAEEVLELARQKCPSCPVITISNSGMDDRRLRPDVVVPAEGGPAALIRALQRAFRTQ